MNKPLISVIIPVYNVEKYLNKCLESVIAQTETRLEIIIVDDGSTDRSGKICDDFISRDKRIRVFHKENEGVSCARNFGIDHASGRYLGFVDSDDYIAPDMYETLLEILERYSAQMSMCGLYDIFDGKPRTVFEHIETYAVDREDAIRMVMEAEVVSVTPVNKLYSRELFNEIRFPIGKTAEDAFVMLELLGNCDKVAITNAQKYFYIHRGESITTSAFSLKNLDAIEAYEKNYDIIKKNYPSLLDVAQMRLCWAYFYVLDRVVFDNTGDYEQIRKKTVDYLNAHLAFILKDKRFKITRKFSALMLRINWRLYKECVILQKKRYRIK